MTPLTRSAYLPAVPSTPPDPGTILLYALSTLAQTCAALAAFVGAVGLYRLQSQNNEHTRNEQTIRGLLAGPILGFAVVPLLPLDEIIRVARANVVTGQSSVSPGVVDRLRNALSEWDGFANRHRRVTWALFIFEGWNLLVIGASLVGFNYIPMLVASPYTFWSLWLVALGTVAVTFYSVFAWTRG